MVNWAEADFNNILRGGGEAFSNVIKFIVRHMSAKSAKFFI